MVPKEPKSTPNGPEGNEEPMMGRDPVQSLFGTSSPGFMHTPEDDIDVIPDEVQTIIDQYEIDTKKTGFTCVLKRCHEGQHDSQGAYINSWRKTAPTLKDIALHYGPGRYIILLQWKQNEYDDEKGRHVQRNKSETIPIIIDEAFRDMHEEYTLDMRVQLAERRRQKLNKAKMSAKIDSQLSLFGEEKDERGQPQNVKEYVRDLAEQASLLGFQRGGGFSLEKIAPLALPLLQYFEKKSELERDRQDKFMLMMMQVMNQSQTQMMELVKNQNGPTSGSEIMNEMSRMVMNSLDLKKSIEDANQKETVVDKVFNLIEGVAPVIVQLASMPKDKAKTSPMYGIAQQAVNQSPEIQEVMGNPEHLKQLVNKLDPQLGTRQVDRLLELAGESRPADCMNNYTIHPEMPPDESEEAPSGEEGQQ